MRTCGGVRFLLVPALCIAAVEFGRAAPAPKELAVRLVARRSEYPLAAGLRGAEVRKTIRKAAREGKVPFAPPAVDVTLEIENRGDTPQTLKIGGDESRIVLTLEGPGAVNADLMIAMTMEYRFGTAITLAPGARHEIPIQSLRSGARGIARGCWWTEPGVYRLSAVLICNSAGDPPKQMEWKTAPIEWKVVGDE